MSVLLIKQVTQLWWQKKVNISFRSGKGNVLRCRTNALFLKGDWWKHTKWTLSIGWITALQRVLLRDDYVGAQEVTSGHVIRDKSLLTATARVLRQFRLSHAVQRLHNNDESNEWNFQTRESQTWHFWFILTPFPNAERTQPVSACFDHSTPVCPSRRRNMATKWGQQET